jgi:hypothetical protein
MDLIFPRLGHVMRIIDDFRHQQFRIKNSVVLRNHAAGDSQPSRKDRQVEENCPMGRDFEVQEEVGVYH